METNSKFYSEQSEKKLLGLLLKDNQLVTRVAGLIEPADFFDRNHQLLFEGINNSFSKHGNADSALLVEELTLISTLKKEDWLVILSNLIVEKGIESNIEKYVELIKDKRHIRDLRTSLQQAGVMVEKGGESVSSLIGDIEGKIKQISDQKELKDFESMESITNEFLLKMKRIEEEGIQPGIRTGLPRLDQSIGGFQEGQFIIIAARPSMGKTAFALDIAKHMAKNGQRVGFFSLEMPNDQLVMRMLSSESMIKSKSMFNSKYPLNQISRERLEVSSNSISNMTMRIDDSSTLKVGELAWKARKAKEQEGLDIIFIDYLQLVDTETKSESRQQQVSEISRQLKALARELKIPVVALSQLSRSVEGRTDKRPMLSDLRESGAIEQDADIIMFLYRDDYYKSKDEQTSAEHQELEVSIGKNRNGSTGKVILGIDLEHGKISSPA